MKIGFQGVLGAYTHLALEEFFADKPHEVVPYSTYKDLLDAVETGALDYAVVPVENSTSGRVAEVHLHVGHANVFLVGEHYKSISHCLLAVPGCGAQVKEVYSYEPALSQCIHTLHSMGLVPKKASDTAEAAKQVAEWGDPTKAALASSLAGEIYGLDIVRRDMQDTCDNTTRFSIVGPKLEIADASLPCKIALLFETQSIPAALYKALGGFATNGVNLTRLESYVGGATFKTARFFAEIEGHVQQPAVQRALEELQFFSQNVRVLGCYPRAEK
ncbi:MAG: prephenate dehydratase domain-containing protein [Alphaproteobacteria bacterium]